VSKKQVESVFFGEYGARSPSKHFSI